MMPPALSSRNAPQEHPLTRPPATQKVHIDGLQFRVQSRGDGPPVLLLHGFPDSLELWREVAPRLSAEGYRTIAVDQRGFGETDAPQGRHRYGTDRLVQDLADLLPALAVDGPVHVVGHDWGSVMAWALAMLRPDLVRSAVAISVGHPHEYLMAGLEQKRKGLYTIGWQFPGLAERWLQANDWASMRHWLRGHPDADGRIRDLARPGRLTAGLNWYRGNVLPGVLRSWPECRVPVLGLWSSRDHCLAEDQMARSGRRVTAAWRYERIEGAAHWLPLEQPRRVAELALGWFRGR
jgi:pimeloyl-ACP methyl ester carboxylesterase